MLKTKSAAKASAVKEAKSQKEVQIIELVRRQGIYTTTLAIEDVKEVEAILSSFNRTSGIVGRKGAKVTELEFSAKGGRSGNRDYCLRLPNIAIDELAKIGFTKDANIETLYTSK